LPPTPGGVYTLSELAFVVSVAENATRSAPTDMRLSNVAGVNVSMVFALDTRVANWFAPSVVTADVPPNAPLSLNWTAPTAPDRVPPPPPPATTFSQSVLMSVGSLLALFWSAIQTEPLCVTGCPTLYNTAVCQISNHPPPEVYPAWVMATAGCS